MSHRRSGLHHNHSHGPRWLSRSAVFLSPSKPRRLSLLLLRVAPGSSRHVRQRRFSRHHLNHWPGRPSNLRTGLWTPSARRRRDSLNARVCVLARGGVVANPGAAVSHPCDSCSCPAAPGVLRRVPRRGEPHIGLGGAECSIRSAATHRYLSIRPVRFFRVTSVGLAGAPWLVVAVQVPVNSHV